MRADPTDQRRLLDLASLDTQLAQLEHRKRTLPEHQQIADLMRTHGTLGEDLVAATTRAGDVEKEMDRLESDLVPARERLVRNRKRVEDGSVGDPKALSGLVEEIDHLSRRISTLEDAELELMQQVEDASTERDQIAERRTEVEQEVRALMRTRDEQGKQLGTEFVERRTERDACTRLLPDELLALYTKIAGRTGGTGAAELRAKRCLGCQLEATLADLRRYAEADPDDVIRCEECDRILVRTEQSGLRTDQ